MTHNIDGIVSVIRDKIQENLTGMRSDTYFANEVRNYYNANPKEYVALLKLFHNDLTNTVCFLVDKLNPLLSSIPVTNNDYAKLDKENKSYIEQMENLQKTCGDMATLEKTKVEYEELSKKVQSNQKKMSHMTKIEEKDYSYQSTHLSGLINKVQNALSEIVPETEPSDLDVRNTVTFDKKMTLQEALFTLLWNTRKETLPISVLNIKSWSARLAHRIKFGEHPMSNLPTMLIFRSRTDNGSVKGSSGKTTISSSCANMLKEKGLNVADLSYSIKMPTYERVDKDMSDKTLVIMEDINWKSAAWEEMNRFLDGMPIKNRGKYLKEGLIFGFGNVLATTNYDLPYTNTKRYPVIEFTPNEASTVCQHPIVKQYAKFHQDEKNRQYSFNDAWETLFSYAFDESSLWLKEYENNRSTVVSQCSVQRSKLENIISAFLSESIANKTRTCFTPSEVLDYIRGNFKGEFSQTPKISSIISSIENLGIEQYNEQSNMYLKMYKVPDSIDDIVNGDDDIQYIWNWITTNV